MLSLHLPRTLLHEIFMYDRDTLFDIRKKDYRSLKVDDVEVIYLSAVVCHLHV